MSTPAPPPPGGLHAAPVGDSTKDQTDRQRDREALEDFNAELQRDINAEFGSQPF